MIVINRILYYIPNHTIIIERSFVILQARDSCMGREFLTLNIIDNGSKLYQT
jgi:hypothetical protein